jgi:hypothetical protein
MEWIGKYIVDKKPDVIIGIGDHADMYSLSSYDKGRSSYHGRRYQEDINCANDAWAKLNKPIDDYNKKRRKNKERQYLPEKHVTLGNHENRINLAIEHDRVMLDGTISMSDLNYKKFGWKVHDFKKMLCIDGVYYTHFVYNPNTGKPYGGNSLDTRLKNIGFTFTMGHQQGKKQAEIYLNNGESRRGLVVGSCYLHAEEYRGPQADYHWMGIIVKNEVHNGFYDLTEVSLNYLCRRYHWKNLGDPDDHRGLKEFMEDNYPDQKNIFAGAA